MVNKNPSPETRFKPGQSGNPGGKTEGQRTAEIEAARISAELRLKALSSLQERMKDSEFITDDDMEMLLNPSTLKLFKDSEDRAHGTPKQAHDHTTNGKDLPAPAGSIDSALADALAKKLTE